MKNLRTAAPAIAAIAACAALTLVGTAPAAAGPGRGRGEAARRIARELDLTVEQREQIREIFRAHWQAGLDDLIRENRDVRRGLARLIHDPGASDSEIRAAVRAAGEPAEDLAVARHRLALDIQDVLTPEQRRRARELGLQLDELGKRALERIDENLRR
jgi:Spy/CpxP family protein refolding chaperone